MKNYLLLISMLLMNGSLFSQDIRTFDFEKVVRYIDSLLCNNKIVWQNSGDTIIFETKNRDIYIEKNIEEYTFLREDTTKLMDTVIKEEWISNLCIGSSKIQLSHGIDSIVIEYWDSRYACSYLICIYDNTKNILTKEQMSGEYITINSIELIKSFITYINDFYIDKTKTIILSKWKADTIVSGDWSSIEVKCYKNGMKVFNKFTWITEEEGQYRFVINPVFLEFYELIKFAVKK